MSEPGVQPNDPLLLACRALARAMDLFDEAACRALGVGRSDLRALNLLEHGALSPGAIADALHLSRPAVTALLDRLVHAGFVSRVVEPGDRRGIRVVLEPATFTAFASVYRPLGLRVHASADHLTPDERRLVVRGLDSMTRAFHEARPPLGAAAVTGPSQLAEDLGTGPECP